MGRVRKGMHTQAHTYLKLIFHALVHVCMQLFHVLRKLLDGHRLLEHW